MSQTTLLIALTAAALAGLVAAMPFDPQEPYKLDLESVMNRTVCPIKVDIDYDAHRIPKRIKVMKCAKDQNQWCSKMHIPQHECCQHQHGTVRLACVEMQDVVQVYYPEQGRAHPYRVSVGCSCVMQESVAVGDFDPSS